MILYKWEAKGPPRPVQALEASACRPSDGFYAGGLYAEGTEVAKGEQNRALVTEVSSTEKMVSLRAFILHHGCRVSACVPSDGPLHKGKVDNTPEVTLSTYQQTRDAKILHSHLQLSNGQAVGPSFLDVLGVREAQI